MTVRADLLKSGFVPNKDKSLWEPVEIISWLGIHLNTLNGTIRATDECIAKLSPDLAAFSSYKTSSAVHVKRVASIAGQIISLSSCLGSVARIMTRFLFSVVNSAVSWDSEVSLSDDSLCEIEFWSNNVHVLNGKIYWGASSLPVRVSFFSDASNSAYGAFVEPQPELTFSQNWSLVESVRSSSWRELKAVCLALEAFASRLSNSKAFWYSDNQNVESILRNGSGKCDLQELALVVFQICLLHRISLEAKWIPRDLNVSVDCISKLVDFDDYGLNDIVFQGLNHLWGPHTNDRFSCSYNAKLTRFNARFFQPGCEAVDAFAQYWGYDNNWLCPPVCLIVRVIKHMELCRAQGTLVLPLWKSAIFWNVCARDGVHWNSFVVDWVYLCKFQGLFVPGKACNSLFGSRPIDFDVVALRVNFRCPRPPSSLAAFALCLTESAICAPKAFVVLRSSGLGSLVFLFLFCM